MRAVRGRSGGVEVVEVDEPAGDGELVTVSSVSICASDLRYLTYGAAGILGHEIAGTTADGTAVVVEGVVGCGACEWCERGNSNLCRRAGTDIMGYNVDGGMAEHFRAPARTLVALPPGLSLDDASLVEPGSVAWHACRTAGVGPHTRVLVVGAGAIGVLAVLASLEMGAPEVSLAARHPFQRSLGEQLGATVPSGLYDVVVEASGTESGLVHSVKQVRPQGTVCTVSVFPADVAWPYRECFVKEVRVVPSIGYCHDGEMREMERVATMLAARPDVTAALITHRFGLEDAVRAFQVASERPPGTFKVVVHP